MKVLIGRLKFTQKLYTNSLIALDTNRKKYKMVYYFINIDKKM